MTWKRALLIVGAGLLIWLRPWRRLLGRGAPAAGEPGLTIAPAAASDSPFPEVLPVEPLRAEEEPVPAPVAQADTAPIAPEDAFGAAPSDEMQADLALDAEPGTTLDGMDELAPEAAFAAPGPELIVGDDLDAALDLVEEPERAPASVDVGAPGIMEFTDDDLMDVPGSLAEPEPDAELEAELIALGEPEPVEMAEDDLIDVPGTVEPVAGSAGAGDEGARIVGETAAKPDDLLVIEGIGPRVSTIVTAAGISSFAELASADVERLRTLLADAGVKTIDPSTWPEQARIANEGRWDDLRALQRRIKNGKKS